MIVLPIKSVREEDGLVIGQDLLNLARLAWFDFPVASGVIVTPPTLKIQTVLEHFQLKDREIFEQRLTLVKERILNIPVPEELEKSVDHHKIDIKKLWHHLLELWINELRSNIWREGFSQDLVKNLSSKPVFFSVKITASGNCFFDWDRKIAIFEINSGEISDTKKEQIEELVKKADKMLALPQVYDWVIENGVKIVKVTPITQYPEMEKIEEDLPTPPEKKYPEKALKSTLKVFLAADESFRTAQNIDGVLINSIKTKDEDQKILQLVEFAQSGLPVVFKLFDDPKAVVRGTLNLVHNPNLLRQEVEVVKFVRHKKNLSNVSLGIPWVRTAEEFKKVKSEISSLGLARGSSFKLWLELSIGENFLNLEDYIQVGFDGALIDLDALSQQIGGFDPEGEEAIFYSKQVKALIKLLEPALKLLHKEKIQVLAYGSLALHDDVLSFLMENGVYGIVTEYVNTFSIQERLRLIERRIVRSRAST